MSIVKAGTMILWDLTSVVLPTESVLKILLCNESLQTSQSHYSQKF